MFREAKIRHYRYRLFFNSHYPLAELKRGIFNLSDGFVVDFVDVLQDGESADLADDSCEQSVYVLGVVSDEEELVAELREVRPDALAQLPEHEGERSGTLLVGTRRCFQPDAGRLEKVKLHLCTDVALVADIVQRPERAGLQTSKGFGATMKQCSPPSMSPTILLRISSHSPAVDLRRSSYRLLDMRFGISSMLWKSMWNRSFSLSMPDASAVMLKAITSRSEKRGTAPRRSTFPMELTRFSEWHLQMSRICRNFAQKLYM